MGRVYCGLVIFAAHRIHVQYFLIHKIITVTLIIVTG